MQINRDLPDTLLHQAEARTAQKGLAVADLITGYVARGLQRNAEVRQRSAPPVIAKAATGKQIAALSADDPIADPAAVVTAGSVRFTVLASRLLRLEYSPAGAFEDRPSQAFYMRDMA